MPRKHNFSEIRRELEQVLSLPLVTRLLREMDLTVRAEIDRRRSELEKVLLVRFHRDEMAKTTNIVQLRKLALCRLGDPRYKDYREKYFDGKSTQA